MTAPINASTSAGVVVTSDTSGSLAIQSNGTTVLTASSAGVTFTTPTTAAPTFSAYQSSTISVPASTYTLMSYQTKVFDTNGCFNNTASTATLNGISVPAYAFAPNVAGYYQITGSWTTNSTALQTLYSTIYKNGTAHIGGAFVYSSGVGGISTVNCLVYLNGVSDYIQMYGFDTISVGSTGGQVYTYFQAAYIRSA